MSTEHGDTGNQLASPGDVQDGDTGNALAVPGDVPERIDLSGATQRQRSGDFSRESTWAGLAWISSQMATEVTKQLCVPTDPSMLRGVPLAHVLRGQGKILCHSRGDESSYEFSSQVLRIRTFLSHNWSVSRWIKMAVLALHFNHLPAMAFALVVVLVCVLLQFFVDTSIGVSDEYTAPGRVSVLSTCVGPFALLVALFYIHEIRTLFGWRGPPVFLDKCCIHQTDVELQREGIKNLAAVLANSDQLLVVYTADYLRKLWTVYELATFLTMRSPDQIVIASPIVVVFWACALVSLQAIFLLAWIPHTEPFAAVSKLPFRVAVGVTMLPCMIMLAGCGRLMKRRFREAEEQLASFHMAAVTCTYEADRKLVEKNISMFIRAIGLVDAEAPHAQVMDVFSQMIRRYLGHLIIASNGRNMLSYSLALSAGFSAFCYGLDTMVVSINSEQSARYTLITLAKWFWVWLIWIPLTCAFAGAAGGWRIHLVGWSSKLHVLLVGLASTSMTGGALFFARALQDRAVSSDVALVLSCLMYCASGFVTAWVFRTHHSRLSMLDLVEEQKSGVVKVNETLSTYSGSSHTTS